VTNGQPGLACSVNDAFSVLPARTFTTGFPDLRCLTRTTLASRPPSASGANSEARSTNSIESMIEICRDHAANVKRWRDGQMVLRWVAAGMDQARRQFRRVNGHLHLAALRAALDATIATVTPTKEDAA
jgi:hypothetical protein